MSVLCYHSVSEEWDSLIAVRPPAFAEQCAWLSHRRHVVPTLELLEAQSAGGRCRRRTALTFDDGFADFATEAAPVLRRYRLPATMFVVAKTLEPGRGGADWLRPQPEVAPPTLTREQVLELREGGVEFGSHSWAHRDLRTLTEEECFHDLRDSRECLEDLLHERVPLLAYPYGNHATHVQRAAARAGYRYSLSLPQGPEVREPHAMPRVGVYRRDSLTAVRVKDGAWYLTLHMSWLNPALRHGRQVVGRFAQTARPT